MMWFCFFLLNFMSCAWSSESMMNQPENTVLLVTVSDDRSGRKGGKYKETQDKIERIFRNNPQFGISKFHMWNWDEIAHTDFYKNNMTLLNNVQADRNGRAYKAFVIYEGLKSLKDGDFLIYTDCSPEMWAFDFMREDGIIDPLTYDLNVLKNLCIENNGILTPYIMWDDKDAPLYEMVQVKSPSQKKEYGCHTHANFTLDRCIQKMGLWEYRNSLQHGSGTIILCKSANTLKFVKEWVYWNSIDECASLGWANIKNDYSFWTEELHIKLGHRHDQSISGLLINKMGYSLIKEPIDLYRPPLSNFLRFARIGIHYDFVDSNITK